MLRFVLLLSSWVLYLIEKLFGINITYSGSLPKEGAMLILANHFTRFETFVVPYILFSKYNRVSRSLSDDSVFIGLLGKYMRLAGTVSIKNETKNEIIIQDLQTAEADWVIYPEGYMIKNKYISFENGEFHIHTKSKERPIYTGAATLALKAQILQEQNQHTSKTPIQIVPLTITYYPIRPGKNRIILWINKYLNIRGTRFFEELEIEFNLLTNANMHLHFGMPISVAEYINKSNQEEDTAYIIDKQRKRVITDAMTKVYNNLQINFDHIFILSLVTMPTLKVCPSYLKTLIYKNAREVRSQQHFQIHPELKDELFNLILDESYAPFQSAIKLAQIQHILYKDSEGEYLFDKNLLEKHYDFDKIRVKNTLQVILNEIQWRKDIVDIAKRNALYSQQELKMDNFVYLQHKERKIYEEEYKSYHHTLPPKNHIGAPIVMYNENNTTALVFSHGYMATPKEAEKLAAFLFQRGINVYLPRLRGHGTDPHALKHISKQDWESDFKLAFTAMRQVCDKVFIGGFSTGGLLALIHASQYKTDGVIAINSALRLNNLQVSYVVPTLHAFNEMITHLKAKGINEWIENKSEHPEINYTKHPLHGIAQMERVMKKADAILTQIHAPLLVIQGDDDPIVNPKSADFIYNGVKSKQKKLVFLPRDKHAVLLEKGKEEIFHTIYNFIINSTSK